MNWSGVMPAATTPFDKQMAVDHKFLTQHVTWLLDNGCTGLVMLGSLGEGATLSVPEKIAVLETAVRAAGKRGPALLENAWFIEKMAHFDREVIPERRMHAKGAGAFGTFTVTHDIMRSTKAKIVSSSASRPRCSPASRPSRAREAPLTPSAISAALL